MPFFELSETESMSNKDIHRSIVEKTKDGSKKRRRLFVSTRRPDAEKKRNFRRQSVSSSINSFFSGKLYLGTANTPYVLLYTILYYFKL